MSIQGKKIAQEKMAIRIANTMAKAASNLADMPAIVAVTQMAMVKAESIRLSNAISCTPHEHFNSKGKIDKRKVKRHRAKSGFKDHTSRILRVNPKCGRPIDIDMANGKDESVTVRITKDDEGNVISQCVIADMVKAYRETPSTETKSNR